MEEIKGWYAYDGHTTSQQHKNIEKVFPILIGEIKPTKIVEIGTSYGGLTLLLRDILDNNNLQSTPIVTYDILDKNTSLLKQIIQEGANIDYRIENIFNHNYDALLEEKIFEIKEHFMQPGPTIVLCDGGNKINEFNLLSDFLRTGDIIMAHDYSPNREYWEKNINNKIWNWLEIQDSDIKLAVERNKLEPYLQEEFYPVVWACRRKV